MKNKFEMGSIFATPGAIELMELCNVNPSRLLDRHKGGDWGDVCDADKQANEDALLNGDRLVSSYAMPEHKHEKILTITEAYRSATTLLLLSEY